MVRSPSARSRDRIFFELFDVAAGATPAARDLFHHFRQDLFFFDREFTAHRVVMKGATATIGDNVEASEVAASRASVASELSEHLCDSSGRPQRCLIVERLFDDTVAMAVLAGQRSFDDLGSPLHDVTFCVVDLETTGGTFLTEAMVTPAPRIEEVLPSLMEFIGGSALARRLVREEVPDGKLGTLASRSRPCPRSRDPGNVCHVLHDVFVTLVVLGLASFALLGGALTYGRWRLRKQLRVRPSTRSRAPTNWLVSMSEPARLHRRLRTAATTARLAGSRGGATIADLANEIEDHAVALETHLVLLSRLWRRERHARKQLIAQVAQLEQLAAHLATSAIEVNRPRALGAGSPDALAELTDRIDALDQARQELEALERSWNLN